MREDIDAELARRFRRLLSRVLGCCYCSLLSHVDVDVTRSEPHTPPRKSNSFTSCAPREKIHEKNSVQSAAVAQRSVARAELR